MPEVNDGKHRSQKDNPAIAKRAEYSKPRLEHLGSIRELTRMPGGSINAEGNSGKPHNR